MGALSSWVGRVAKAIAASLVRAQLRRPRTVVLVVLVSLIPSLFLASSLHVKTGFRDLLPNDMDSAVEQRRLEERMGGNGSLVIVVQGGNVDRQRQFMNAMNPRLHALGPEWVRGVDAGMRELLSFLEKHWYVYANEHDLAANAKTLSLAKDRAVLRSSGLDLGLDPDLDPDLNLDPDLVPDLDPELHLHLEPETKHETAHETDLEHDESIPGPALSLGKLRE